MKRWRDGEPFNASRVTFRVLCFQFFIALVIIYGDAGRVTQPTQETPIIALSRSKQLDQVPHHPMLNIEANI